MFNFKDETATMSPPDRAVYINAARDLRTAGTAVIALLLLTEPNEFLSGFCWCLFIWMCGNFGRMVGILWQEK